LVGNPIADADASALTEHLFAVITLHPLSTKDFVAYNPTPDVVPVINTVPGAACTRAIFLNKNYLNQFSNTNLNLREAKLIIAR
jgi:hypothetical protein